MALKVQSLAEISEEYIMALLYGGPGVGKTIFGCGSKTMKTLLIDVDDGSSSARNWPHTNLGNVDVVKAHSKIEFDEAIKIVGGNLRKYNLIVVDTVTELQWVLLTEVCKQNNLITPRQQEWGAVLNVMMTITLAFKHLPVHVLFNAHELARNETDVNGTVRTSYVPSFKGAYASDYAKHFSEVGRYFMVPREVEVDGKVETQYIRAIQWHKDPSAPDAKDRSQALKKYEEPNIDSIFQRASAGLAALKKQGQ